MTAIHTSRKTLGSTRIHKFIRVQIKQVLRLGLLARQKFKKDILCTKFYKIERYRKFGKFLRKVNEINKFRSYVESPDIYDKL